MLVFIDDSGDPGFKVAQGSSQFFVIALLIFDDTLEAEKMAVAIKEFRRSIGFPDYQEFKFNKSKQVVRAKFLETISPFSFRIRVLVVDKILIESPELKKKRERFYAYFIKMAIKYSAATILNARIRIDGSGDRAFKKEFQTYLRKELNTSERQIMKNCRLVDSKNDVLIQAVDVIAGAIRRKHEQGDLASHSIIKKHIENEWMFQ